MSSGIPPIDVLLYVALSEEFNHLFDELFNELGYKITWRELDDVAAIVFYCEIFSPILKKNFQLAIAPAGEIGNISAATVISTIIEKSNSYDVDVVVLGIAGSLSNDLQPGDVFIPHSVKEYLANSATRGNGDAWTFDTSGHDWPTSSRLLKRFQFFRQTQKDFYEKWSDDCAARFAPIFKDLKEAMTEARLDIRPENRLVAGDARKLASGSSVGKGKAFVEWLKGTVDRKVAAMDMESAGVYKAVQLRIPTPRVIAIRGISDCADERKELIENVAKDRFRVVSLKNALSLLVHGIEAGLFEKNHLEKRLPLYRHRFISPELRSKLDTLLAQADLPTDKIRVIFDDCLSKIEPYPEHQPQCTQYDLDCLLNYLIDKLGHLQGATNIKVPLLEFIARLREYAANATELNDWLIEAGVFMKQVGLNDAYIAALGCTEKIEAPKNDAVPYLLVELAAEDGNRQSYQMQAWLIDRRGKEKKIKAQDKVTLEQMSTLFKQLYEHKQVKTVRAEKNARIPLRLEFFLPQTLLDSAIPETWGSENQNRTRQEPLSYNHSLVVRSQERMRGDDFFDNWGEWWKKWKDRRDKAPDDDSMQWVNSATELCPSDINDGIVFFALEFPPDTACLCRLLRAGVAMILWSNTPFDADIKDQIRTQIGRSPLGELPIVLRKVRQRLWDETRKAFDSGESDQPPHTGRLNLLWDDPCRNPRDWEDDFESSL